MRYTLLSFLLLCFIIAHAQDSIPCLIPLKQVKQIPNLVMLDNGGFFTLYLSQSAPDCGMAYLAMEMHQPDEQEITQKVLADIQKFESGYGYTHPCGIHTIRKNEIEQTAQSNINTLAGTIPGVDSRNGQTPHIKGARADGTAYFIDGLRIQFAQLPENTAELTFKPRPSPDNHKFPFSRHQWPHSAYFLQ